MATFKSLRQSTDVPKQDSRHETGQSLVEMAIMLPLLLIIFAGVLDFGRVIYINLVMTNAAREVALSGATRSIESGLLRNLVSEEIERAGVSDGGTADTSIGYTQTGDPGRDTIVVDISYRVVMSLTFLPFSELTLRSHAEMPLFWSLDE